MYITSSIMHTILKATRAGVGFGSGTKTSMHVHKMSLKTSLYRIARKFHEGGNFRGNSFD